MGLTQTIELEVGDDDFTFNVTGVAYDTYCNDTSPFNKVAPAKEFLLGCIDADQRQLLKEKFKDTPGYALQVTAAVINQYQPTLEISVKKSKPARGTTKKAG